MKQKKKIIHFLWGVPVFIICLVIGSTVAYAAMMVREEKANLFQIGNLQTKVEEVFTEPVTMLPNKPVEKKVTIANIGTVNQFVRVMLHPEIRLESNSSIQLLPSKIGEEILLDLNNIDWKLGEDGYYYYLKALRTGESNRTENLFTQVKLKNELGKKYHGATFSFLIKVEAINCAKFAYRDVWWQGVTPNSGELKVIDSQLAKQID
ncbi:hypothetical protein ACWOC1_05070 [Enterococcus quebecensis]|uniref:Alternate signal-mediated exported protein, CPF_0494 family n=1 Tax=Enterococcus quebecensis TaxID=903983 RepID=A0A1E5GWH0_9ENTE|nr:hypothetical protein [Enterococcus quebecensis]OEG17007.1 hypothetical protein BCR23_03080 [Enterococcus quebecensis]OJG75377.1 hypothetical protein RV12_GL001180 [Enterococcus quebecensis]